MRTLKRVLKSGLTGATFLSLLWMASNSAFANPTGPSVVAGGASVSGLGTPHVTIDQTTPQAILHWEQFNIAPSEITRFVQPSAQAIALNRIFDANPSQILGRLQANGSVILLNPNGVIFGQGAQVNVSGLIASSLALTDENFLNGRYLFEGSPLGGSVTNAGTIDTGPGGFVYLLAPNVENSGVIQSPEGHITLAAGTTAYLSNRPDGRGFLVEVTAPSGEALNLKDLIADGGRINLFGRVVNQSGVIRANSVRERSGRIEIYATERIALKEGSRIVAKGGEEGVSDGGSVIVLADKSAGETRFDPGAFIDVSGGAAGGNGGFAEISGHHVTLGGSVVSHAVLGYGGGRFLLDPFDLVVDEKLFADLSQKIQTQEIEIQADNDIMVIASADLSLWPSHGWGERTLRFRAGNDLLFNGVLLSNLVDGFGTKWHFGGIAGRDIALTGSQIWMGNGGSIVFEAGRDIRLIQGNRQGINHSYLWTVDGGDIRLKAGQDLIAPSVFDRTIQMYSGIRLGALVFDGAGHTGVTDRISNLTIEVGRDFLGGIIDAVPSGPGFVLAHGRADISVGRNLGSLDSYSDLTLGKGGIAVNAGQNIYLGLVQDLGIAEAAGGTAILDSGNAVSLTAVTGNIHLRPEAKNVSFTAQGQLMGYYPPSFRASALQGDIFIESNRLSFWPSLTGSLDFSAFNNIQGNPATGGAATLSLVSVDPDRLIGGDATEIASLINRDLRLADNIPDHPAVPVRFRTDNGDISRIYFNLKSPSLNKEVTIASGRDLKNFVAEISVPEGKKATISAERDINMGKVETAENRFNFTTGVTFYGTGQGRIRAGRDLDLADGDGISQRLFLSNESVPRGGLDISVGGDLKMTKSKIYTYNGAFISIHGLNGQESPVGGSINVGTNETGNSLNDDRGIVTIRGGEINIRSTGDVDVNASRVATVGGGDIKITSTSGNINAGFGNKDDLVNFLINEFVVDENGNVVLNDQGKPFLRARVIHVPGSGIFTYHGSDPSPLPPYPPKPTVEIPPFQPILPPPPPEPALPPFPDRTPRMVQLEAEILKQRILGHDTAGLEQALLTEFEKQAHDYESAVTELYAGYRVEVENYRTGVEASYQNQLQAYREQIKLLQQRASLEYEAIKAEHRKDWRLGDIELTAKEAAVVVPPAGIRGRKITIVAKALDLQGGEIGGDTNVNVEELIGDRGNLEFTGRIGGEVLTSIEIELPSIPTVTLPPLPSITLPSIPTGGATGGGSLGGLSGSTGSLSTASSGSVATASSAAATVQETIAEKTEAPPPEEEMVASAETLEEEKTEKKPSRTRTGIKKGRKGRGFTGFQIKRGVVIEVEVHEDPG